MLNKRSETIANILNDILRLIMKFHWSLCSRSWHIPTHQENKKTCHYEHPNFNVLRRIHGAFEEMTDFLLKYAWRLASHGYQASLFELLQMLNVNNFY
ncbi:hypothetical protein J437_LFUL010290 [Ladona fulva]|uniref:Gamma tubulin complex component C-terminal domain-containing protein n=1 Tax=Ladona fulva TaxID=123851 RepID=A0A8K0KBZ5_LADFU|nr:hypothetical protein J437_LFUL010290 [Ladona fulva]